MTPSILTWLRDVVRLHSLTWCSVLEVGSLDVNGSPRCLFDGPYVGVDMRDGPGVDRIMDAARLDYIADAFDVVITTSMLEHCADPIAVMHELYRVTRPGGFLLLSAPGFWGSSVYPEHDEPVDYWRFGPGCLDQLAASVGYRYSSSQRDPEAEGWLLSARKP